MDRIPACRQAGKFPEIIGFEMWFTYAIQSRKDNRIYVGMSMDPQKRLTQHNQGKTKSTKGFVPWRLIYQEQLTSRLAARRKEKYLKSGAGKEFLKSLVP